MILRGIILPKISKDINFTIKNEERRRVIWLTKMEHLALKYLSTIKFLLEKRVLFMRSIINRRVTTHYQELRKALQIDNYLES